MNGQQKEKEVISGYWGATSSEKQTGEGSSYSVEAAACTETAPTTVSSHCQTLEEIQQRMCHSGSARSKAKDFEYGKIMQNILK